MAPFSVLVIAHLLWLFFAVYAEIPGAYTGRPLESAPAMIYAASGTMESHRIEPELKKQSAIGRPHSAETDRNPAERRPDGFWQVGTQAGTYMYHTGAASSSPIPAANPHSHSWMSFKLQVIEYAESKAQPPLSTTAQQSSPPLLEPPYILPAEIENESESKASPPQSSPNKPLLKLILKLLIVLQFVITTMVGVIYSIFTHRRLTSDIEAGMGHIELI